MVPTGCPATAADSSTALSTKSFVLGSGAMSCVTIWLNEAVRSRITSRLSRSMTRSVTEMMRPWEAPWTTVRGLPSGSVKLQLNGGASPSEVTMTSNFGDTRVATAAAGPDSGSHTSWPVGTGRSPL